MRREGEEDEKRGMKRGREGGRVRQGNAHLYDTLPHISASDGTPVGLTFDSSA